MAHWKGLPSPRQVIFSTITGGAGQSKNNSSSLESSFGSHFALGEGQERKLCIYTDVFLHSICREAQITPN